MNLKTFPQNHHYIYIQDGNNDGVNNNKDYKRMLIQNGHQWMMIMVLMIVDGRAAFEEKTLK